MACLHLAHGDNEAWDRGSNDFSSVKGRSKEHAAQPKYDKKQHKSVSCEGISIVHRRAARSSLFVHFAKAVELGSSYLRRYTNYCLLYCTQ